MSGTFDSALSALSFFEGAIASSSVTVTAGNAYVLPYDVEVVSAAVIGTPATTAQFIWADVQKIPAGTTTATSLFSRPSAVANIASLKLDQSYITVKAAAAVSTTAAATATATTVVAVTAGSGFAVGQGIVVAGTNSPGNYIASISGNNLTLAKAVTVNNGAAIAAYTSPTPQPGQQVQVLGLTDPFFKTLVNSTTGSPTVTSYTAVDYVETTSGQFFRIGPIKQAGLYNTSTGFWEFTKPETTISAGTFQIVDAPVLPGASGQSNATYNYPDVLSKVEAGATLRVLWKAVDAAGVTRTTTATATNVTLSLAVKKV